MLIRAKKFAGHGGWEGLFERAKRTSKGAENVHFEFTSKQARLYMRAAKTPKLTRYLVKQDEASAFNLDRTCRAGCKKATRIPTGRDVKIGKNSMETAQEQTRRPSWEIVDHCCRVCFGRLLERIDEQGTKIVRCAECGTTVQDSLRKLCCCGIKLRTGRNAGYRCVKHEPTPELPAEIVVEFTGFEKVKNK